MAGDPQYVIPDLVVEKVDEKYVVYLNDKNIPRLRISQAYQDELMKDNGKDGNKRDERIHPTHDSSRLAGSCRRSSSAAGRWSRSWSASSRSSGSSLKRAPHFCGR